MIISVVGLGKLGASMAAAMAMKGHEVIAVDVNQKTVDSLNAGHAPVQETNLEEIISANCSRLRATLSHRDAVVESELTFVVVPTPSDERGAFSLQYAVWAFTEIGKALAEKSCYHNVVLTSTVLPGATRYGLLPILERESGKTSGEDFGVCYSPEFIALGSVIRDFLNPDFILIGQFDDHSGTHLEQVYSKIVENRPTCRRMSIENAELAKISVNAFVTMKITFANMLADFCERIPGGNVDVVTGALGLDKRIGLKYLKGGLGYGGPCFPRDNIALEFVARTVGATAELARATDRTNRAVPERIMALIKGRVKKGATVAILGLAYKPFSHVVEESQSIYIVKALNSIGYRVVAYDPLANAMARAELRDQAVILDSATACLEQADAVLIATPDPLFGGLRTIDFMKGRTPKIVIDCWRILSHELTDCGEIEYVPLGCSLGDTSNSELLRRLWETR
jgi:UDPglucose 6-dehydrogenase